MNPKIDCKDVSRQISEGQDLTLPPADQARLRLHFVICETCRNVRDQFDFLRRAMGQFQRGAEADGSATQ